MEYRIQFTTVALSQLKETAQYIAGTLAAPGTASKWSMQIRKEIAALSTMPRRFPLLDEEPWKTEGYRKMPVGNYIVYYQINDDIPAVRIVAVIYGRRDQLSALGHLLK